MKVLFVAEDYPYPPDNGGRLRTFNLLSRLCMRHEITLIAPSASDVSTDRAFGSQPMHIKAVPPADRSISNKFVSLLSSHPYAVCKYGNKQLSDCIQRALSENHYDLLHCDSVLITQAIPKSGITLPRILNAHNVEAVLWERYLTNELRPWMIPLLQSQAKKVSRYEHGLCKVYDHCLTVSEKDKVEIISRYGYGPEDVSVVVNGVDIRYYTPLPEVSTPTLAFVGSLDYSPNKDAIRWFVRTIWPRIKMEIPAVEMLVIGRRPPLWMVNACKSAGISLYADVPDTRPYLAKAAVIVVPLRIGGGTRLKILEALATCRCVISTRVGAEGLDVCDGEHLLIADDPVDFADGVISLLRDPLQRKSFAKSGRNLIEEKYNWEHAAMQMEDAWQRVLIKHNNANNSKDQA